jgi:ribosomal protein L11 methyltransferase
MPFPDPQSTHDTTIATLETDEQSARRLADLFAEAFGAADVAVSLVDAGQGNWRVTLYFRSAIDEATVRDLAKLVGGAEAARALHFDHIAATDWVAQSLVGLKPVAAGRFVVHGAHDRGRVPKNRIGIEIEAALAFGTGHHGTTRGCLLALDAVCKGIVGQKIARTSMRVAGTNRLQPFRGRRSNISGRRRRSILDVGTGSGVLAIAAARALRRFVLATDIDALAVKAAHANARHNGAGCLLSVRRADGVGARAIGARAPFDLIFANILLGPLKRMATPLRRLAAPGGRIVLSGILPAQANAVIAAYRPLALQRRLDIDGWTTLVLVRGRARHHRT